MAWWVISLKRPPSQPQKAGQHRLGRDCLTFQRKVTANVPSISTLSTASQQPRRILGPKKRPSSAIRDEKQSAPPAGRDFGGDEQAAGGIWRENASPPRRRPSCSRWRSVQLFGACPFFLLCFFYTVVFESLPSSFDSMEETNKENVSPSWLPQVGQKFKNLDDAWSFWVNYGGHVGFEVRKRYTNESKYDGKVTSCRYVCAKEGYRAQDKRDHNTKNPRAETRTGCPVRMGLTLDREDEKYEVFDLMLAHNHVLYLPQTFHLMSSQRKISEVQAFEIEAADDSGIRPKDAHEFASRQVGGPMNLSYTCRDHKNYLQSRRQRELAYEQAPMRSTQLSESFNSDIKNHLKSDFDIIRFLKHFERAVQGKRNKELNKEFEARKKEPRIRMKTPMLLQAGKLYTAPIFEAFQSEYERSMAACARELNGNNTYAVAIVRSNGDFSSEKERIVVGDPLEQTALCSCEQFKRTGVLCAHALKVLS